MKVQKKLNFILTTPAKAAQARDRVVTPSSSRSIEERNEQLKKKQTKVYSAGLAKTRLAEFPDQFFEIPDRTNTLFCRCCGRSVDLKKTTVQTHVTSARHTSSREKYLQSRERDSFILDFFDSQSSRYNGDTLPKDIIKGRMRVLRVMMLSGIPLYKLDDEVSGLKELLQAGSSNLSYSALRDLIPNMRSCESTVVKREIPTSTRFTIITDGTTDVCEICTVLVRWLSVEGKIEQRIVACKMYKKSMNAQELATVIHECVFQKLQLNILNANCICRDGASVNTLATKLLKTLAVDMYDSICMSHSGSLCGNLFECDFADKFVSIWSNLMNTSNFAKELFVDDVESKAKRKSMVRWGAKFTVVLQIVKEWVCVKRIIQHDGDFAPELRASLRAFLLDDIGYENHCTHVQWLMLELAVQVDAAQCIFDLVYDYEGDGLLSLTMYPAISKVYEKLCRIVDLRSPTDLNTVFQCVRSFFPEGTPNIDQVRNDVYIAMCEKVRPVRDKFYEIFYAGKSSETVQLYKYFNMLLLPCNLLLLDGGSVRAGLLYIVGHISTLSKIGDLMVRLEAEYNLYRHLAPTAPADAESDVLPWWQGQRNTLPSWHLLFEQAVLLHPNSAGAERVFALYKNLFGKEQQALLEDYKETAVMMRYNEIQRYKDRQNVYEYV